MTDQRSVSCKSTVSTPATIWNQSTGPSTALISALSTGRTAGITQDVFRALVDQLVEQHQNELAEAERATVQSHVSHGADDSINGSELRPKRISVCRREAAEFMRSPSNNSKLSLQQSFQLLQSQSLELPNQVGLRAWLQSNTFELLIAVALCLNVLWIAIEVQIFGAFAGADLGIPQSLVWVSFDAQPTLRNIFNCGNAVFTVFFALDVIVRMCVLKLDFWKAYMNYIDLIVCAASVAEVAFYYSESSVRNLGILRVLRVGLLSFFQCVAGLVLSTLSYDFIVDASLDPGAREEIFRYYGTFTRASLTMFEILFGNFGPPARLLVENVTEWYAPVLLGYRCVFLYATLNVINAAGLPLLDHIF
eukprot:Skav202044  [mRNA]  locus=scaffold1138:355323:358916:- [translate_table: standard]